MRRALATLAVLLELAPVARGHVGSPNVFFEGRAGAYPVSVVVRPPAALPGAAQVSVRVDASDVRAVSLLPVLWEAGREGSPAPVLAERVQAERLWSADVWLLRPGSYGFQVRVEGERGIGEAAVPVNVLGTGKQAMKPGVAAGLGVLGLLLLAGAGLIAQAVGREGSLRPGGLATPRDAVRGQWAGGVALLVLVAGGVGCGVRWQKMASAYLAAGMQKPEPVAATLRTEGQRVFLELRQADEPSARPPWSALVPDHGKLMHLFLIRQPAQDIFAHLHPVRQGADTFTVQLPALPAGGYELYGEVTYENGLNQTLVAHVALPQQTGSLPGVPESPTNFFGSFLCGVPTSVPTAPGALGPDRDDSWHVGRDSGNVPGNRKSAKPPAGALVAPLMGGYTLLFENASAVAAGREASLRFVATAPGAGEAELQPYMGMRGHAVVRRADGSVFAHLHPAGSFSMASQEAFLRAAESANVPGQAEPTPAKMPAATASASAGRVAFPYEFPKPGTYRLWIQVRIAGRVLTGVYDLEIAKAAAHG